MRKYQDKFERRRTIGWTASTAVTLRKAATKSEIVFRKKLLDAGYLRFRFQKWWILQDDIFITDFYLFGNKMVIEVDGPYHFNKSQLAKDDRRDGLLLKEKDVSSILRISDDQAFYLSALEIKKIIESVKPGEVLSLF